MNIKTSSKTLMTCGAFASALLVGCSTTPQLYQWESYQPQVYEYLKGQGGGPEEQITSLERDLQKIRSKGNSPPPGYHAHLGLLYAQIGRGDQVIQEFQTEKTLFPESSMYMDFLLKKFSK